MRKEAVRYWDEVAAQDLPAVRDAMLAGFRSERAFDESGRVDVRHSCSPSSRAAILDVFDVGPPGVETDGKGKRPRK